MNRLRWVAVVAATAAVFAMGGGTATAESNASTEPSAESPAGKSAATDPDPHWADKIPSDNAALSKQKDAALANARQQRSAYPDAWYLWSVHQGRQRSYWCGPATLAMAMVHRGITVSQTTAASQLGTTTNGTDAGAMARVLRSYTNNYYVQVTLPYSPSTADKETYVSRLKSNIMNASGYSVVGNTWEVAGGPHLPGHPNTQIFHYVDIRGYNHNGYTSGIADPATTVWAGVPAYSDVNSYTLTTIMGGRGYYW